MPYSSSSTRHRLLGLLAGMVLAVSGLDGGVRAQGQSWGSPASQWRQPAAPAPPSTQELELQADAGSLERIEGARESLQDGRSSSEAVTDVLVRLKRSVRRYGGAARDLPAVAEPTYIEATILVVSRGRVNPAGQAQCNRFDGDVLVCAMDCDGGTFGLRRGQRAGEHFLIVGLDGASGSGGSPGPPARRGLRVGSCANRGAAALSLMPREGRLAAEIRLLEQR